MGGALSSFMGNARGLCCRWDETTHVMKEIQD